MKWRLPHSPTLRWQCSWGVGRKARQAGPAEAPVLLSLCARARDLRERLTAFLEQRLPDSVYWIECGGGGRGASLHTAPIEVGEGIMGQDFEPRPSYEVCSWCDYRLICPAAET